MSGYIVRHPRDVKPGDLVDVFPAGAPIPVPPPAIYGPGRRELVDGLALGLVDVPDGPSRDNPRAPAVAHCPTCRCD